MTRKIGKSNWMLILPMAVAGVAYLMLLFLPGKAQIKELRAELKNQQAIVLQAQSVKLEIHELQQNIDETREYVRMWNEQHDEEPGRVLARISDEIQSRGIVIQDFDPQPTIRHETVQLTPLEVRIGGQFSAVFELIRSLESLDDNVWIHRIRCEAPLGEGRELSSEISLAIFTVNPSISD